MQTLRILVVDDDATTLDYTELLLALHGYHVFAYMTTLDVCAQCHQHQPQLVIVDLHCPMPHAGWQLFQALRAQHTTAHIPVLLCSSDHDALQMYHVELRAQGCDVLKKPFLPQELFAKIEALTTG